MAHPTLSYMSLFPCIPPSVFCRGTRISFQNHWALVGCVFRLVSGFVTTLQAMHGGAEGGEADEQAASSIGGIRLTPNQLRATRESMPSFLEAM